MRAARRGGGRRGGGGAPRGRGRGNAAAGGGKAARATALSQFDAHFARAYGSRWDALKGALAKPVEHVCWANPFAKNAVSQFEAAQWGAHPHRSGCLLLARRAAADEIGSGVEISVEMPSPTADETSSQRMSHYALDGASPLPALALAPRAGHRVLDLCAAPGGKSLCLAGQMWGATFAAKAGEGEAAWGEAAGDAAAEGGAPVGSSTVVDEAARAGDGSDGGTPPVHISTPSAAAVTPTTSARTLLISNDRSAPRRARLRRVLEEYLPRELIREPSELPAATWGGDAGSYAANAAEKAASATGGPPPLGAIAVTGVDATAWGRGAAAPAWSSVGFERVLVDAPCSSERHFVHGAADALWSRSRLKRDAELQGAILRNAVRLLAVGGRLVYSTCSLADEENDGVVSRLLKHQRHGAGLVLVDALGGALEEPSLAPLLDGVSRTKCGALMLPDRSRFGPLYWAVIERRAPAPADHGSSTPRDEAARGDNSEGSTSEDGEEDGLEEEDEDEQHEEESEGDSEGGGGGGRDVVALD